jgi:hypothetical protein
MFRSKTMSAHIHSWCAKVQQRPIAHVGAFVTLDSLRRTAAQHRATDPPGNGQRRTRPKTVIEAKTPVLMQLSNSGHSSLSLLFMDISSLQGNVRGQSSTMSDCVPAVRCKALQSQAPWRRQRSAAIRPHLRFQDRIDLHLSIQRRRLPPWPRHP